MNFQTATQASAGFDLHKTQQYSAAEKKSTDYQNELEKKLKDALKCPLQSIDIAFIDGANEKSILGYLQGCVQTSQRLNIDESLEKIQYRTRYVPANELSAQDRALKTQQRELLRQKLEILSKQRIRKTDRSLE